MNLFGVTTKVLVLTSLLTVAAACTPKAVKRDASSIVANNAAETLGSEPFIVRVQDESSSKVMSLKLKYFGKKGLKKNLEGQTDAVQNLVISVLADFNYQDLKNSKRLRLFEQSVLSSLNEFIAENKFTNVELAELKEI